MPGSVNLGTVHIDLEMRLQKMKAGISEAKRELGGLQKSAEAVGTSMQRVGRNISLAITAPLVLLGKQAIKTAAEMDAMTKGMTSMMGSSKEAAKEIARLREVAKLPGLGFEDAVRGSLRLQGMGTSAEEARKILLAFGNAVAKMGGGMAELDGVTRALGQTLAKGKVSMEEVLQLAERQIPVFQAMKSIWGTADTEVLKKMGVSAQEFVTKLTDFFGAQEKVADGAKNKIENLGQAWDQFLGKIGETLLKGGIQKAMDGIIKKLEEAVNWFNKLDPAAQTAFTNITIALAVTGPLMVAIGGVVKGIAGIGTALTFLGKHPVLTALLGGAGIASWWFASGADKDFQSGMDKFLDDLFSSLGLKKKEPLLPKIGPFAPRPGMGNQLGEVITPGPGGTISLKDFIPFAKGGAKAGVRVRKGGKPPAVADPEALKRARELLSLNMDTLAELTGGESEILREAQRMRNRGVREDLVQMYIKQKMAPIVQKRNEIMMGDVLRQGREEVRGIPSIRRPEMPSLMGLRGMEGQAFPGANAWAKFGEWIREQRARFFPPQEEPMRMSVLSAAAFGAGQAPKAIKPREIETQMKPGLKALSFNLGEEFGNNFASEMGRAFGDMFDRIFGTKNPLARAISRTLSRLVDDIMYALAQKAFGQHLILSLFGGAGGGALGGLFGGSGGGVTTVGALGLGAGAAGPPVFKAAGAKAGATFGTQFALSAAAVIGGAWGLSRILNSIFPGSPGGRGNLRNMFSSDPGFRASNFSMHPMTGVNYFAVNFSGPISGNQQSAARFADSLAWHANQKLRSRGG